MEQVSSTEDYYAPLRVEILAWGQRAALTAICVLPVECAATQQRPGSCLSPPCCVNAWTSSWECP